MSNQNEEPFFAFEVETEASISAMKRARFLDVDHGSYANAEPMSVVFNQSGSNSTIGRLGDVRQKLNELLPNPMDELVPTQIISNNRGEKFQCYEKKYVGLPDPLYKKQYKQNEFSQTSGGMIKAHGGVDINKKRITHKPSDGIDTKWLDEIQPTSSELYNHKMEELKFKQAARFAGTKQSKSELPSDFVMEMQNTIRFEEDMKSKSINILKNRNEIAKRSIPPTIQVNNNMEKLRDPMFNAQHHMLPETNSSDIINGNTDKLHGLGQFSKKQREHIGNRYNQFNDKHAHISQSMLNNHTAQNMERHVNNKAQNDELARIDSHLLNTTQQLTTTNTRQTSIRENTTAAESVNLLSNQIIASNSLSQKSIIDGNYMKAPILQKLSNYYDQSTAQQGRQLVDKKYVMNENQQHNHQISRDTSLPNRNLISDKIHGRDADQNYVHRQTISQPHYYQTGQLKDMNTTIDSHMGRMQHAQHIKQQTTSPYDNKNQNKPDTHNPRQYAQFRDANITQLPNIDPKHNFDPVMMKATMPSNKNYGKRHELISNQLYFNDSKQYTPRSAPNRNIAHDNFVQQDSRLPQSNQYHRDSSLRQSQQIFNSIGEIKSDTPRRSDVYLNDSKHNATQPMNQRDLNKNYTPKSEILVNATARTNQIQVLSNPNYGKRQLATLKEVRYSDSNTNPIQSVGVITNSQKQHMNAVENICMDSATNPIQSLDQITRHDNPNPAVDGQRNEDFVANEIQITHRMNYKSQPLIFDGTHNETPKTNVIQVLGQFDRNVGLKSRADKMHDSDFEANRVQSTIQVDHGRKQQFKVDGLRDNDSGFNPIQVLGQLIHGREQQLAVYTPRNIDSRSNPIQIMHQSNQNKKQRSLVGQPHNSDSSPNPIQNPSYSDYDKRQQLIIDKPHDNDSKTNAIQKPNQSDQNKEHHFESDNIYNHDSAANPVETFSNIISQNRIHRPIPEKPHNNVHVLNPVPSLSQMDNFARKQSIMSEISNNDSRQYQTQCLSQMDHNQGQISLTNNYHHFDSIKNPMPNLSWVNNKKQFSRIGESHNKKPLFYPMQRFAPMDKHTVHYPKTNFDHEDSKIHANQSLNPVNLNRRQRYTNKEVYHVDSSKQSTNKNRMVETNQMIEFSKRESENRTSQELKQFISKPNVNSSENEIVALSDKTLSTHPTILRTQYAQSGFNKFDMNPLMDEGKQFDGRLLTGQSIQSNNDNQFVKQHNENNVTNSDNTIKYIQSASASYYDQKLSKSINFNGHENLQPSGQILRDVLSTNKMYRDLYGDSNQNKQLGSQRLTVSQFQPKQMSDKPSNIITEHVQRNGRIFDESKYMIAPLQITPIKDQSKDLSGSFRELHQRRNIANYTPTKKVSKYITPTAQLRDEEQDLSKLATPKRSSHHLFGNRMSGPISGARKINIPIK